MSFENDEKELRKICIFNGKPLYFETIQIHTTNQSVETYVSIEFKRLNLIRYGQ